MQVREGHLVTYDTRTEAAIRSIHVAGTLRFDPDRDTRLDVGLIKIQAGDDASMAVMSKALSGRPVSTSHTASGFRSPRVAAAR